MKKRYGNRQNMMEVFMAFAVPQLFLGLMFKRLTFGEKLPFILAVALRERMRLRGLTGARDEFQLAAIVQNLKTLANYVWRPPPDKQAAACVT